MTFYLLDNKGLKLNILPLDLIIIDFQFLVKTLAECKVDPSRHEMIEKIGLILDLMFGLILGLECSVLNEMEV